MTAEERVPRRVVAAAVKLKDGRVICGVRHFDVLMRMWLPDDVIEAHKLLEKHEQGFVDNRYQFLNRAEAWALAVKERQILVPFEGCHGTLRSEDVW